jgi:hypothetical protein
MPSFGLVIAGVHPARRIFVRAAELAELFERSCFLSLRPFEDVALSGLGSGLVPGFFWAIDSLRIVGMRRLDDGVALRERSIRRKIAP